MSQPSLSYYVAIPPKGYEATNLMMNSLGQWHASPEGRYGVASRNCTVPMRHLEEYLFRRRPIFRVHIAVLPWTPTETWINDSLYYRAGTSVAALPHQDPGRVTLRRS